jgi:hypothetical protein
VAQEVDCLPNKHEALNSHPSTPKKEKKKKTAEHVAHYYSIAYCMPPPGFNPSITNKYINKCKNIFKSQVPVAHACNPSH